MKIKRKQVIKVFWIVVSILVIFSMTAWTIGAAFMK